MSDATEVFLSVYGKSAAQSKSEDVARRLAELPSGERLLSALAPGLYDDGFLSIASLREEVSDLGGWERFLPAGSFWYAASALGILYIAAPDDRMWLVHTRAGSVMQTDFALDEAILKAATPSTANDLLLRPVFKAWPGDTQLLAQGALLAPVPITADDLWQVDRYEPMTSADYLAASAALFEPLGPVPVNVMAGDS
ncbi:hypothetical protein [Sphingomonas sp. LM7]|uniref:hypothetical protein n=1 Tax=Sphingomonas sp. LM7 TaxID=1938607 RepID=UPI000983C971|nr:hypothetical protein [Sphingomonas sp. LM7]AQR73126.1 hypothetical protein BXU08_05045 [Sphingomonas sp. LM7]